jgi:hypothetical protein
VAVVCAHERDSVLDQRADDRLGRGSGRKRSCEQLQALDMPATAAGRIPEPLLHEGDGRPAVQ